MVAILGSKHLYNTTAMFWRISQAIPKAILSPFSACVNTIKQVLF